MWQQTIEFVRDPKRRTGPNITVSMRGSFTKLRLYHVLDLVRMVNEEFATVHPTRNETPIENHLNDEDFVLVIACILHGFSPDWEKFSDASEFPKCHRDLLETLNISEKFFSRWAKYSPETPLNLATFLEEPTRVSLELHKRPKVCNNYHLCSLSNLTIALHRTVAHCST